MPSDIGDDEPRPADESDHAFASEEERLSEMFGYPVMFKDLAPPLMPGDSEVIYEDGSGGEIEMTLLERDVAVVTSTEDGEVLDVQVVELPDDFDENRFETDDEFS